MEKLSNEEVLQTQIRVLLEELAQLHSRHSQAAALLNAYMAADQAKQQPQEDEPLD